MDLFQRNRELFLVVILILLPVSGGMAMENPTGSGVLTLDDVISIALGANRSLISSTYGVEGQALSLKVAQSEFDTKLFPQASASTSDQERRIGGGLSLKRKFSLGPEASITPEVFRSYDDTDGTNYNSRLGVSLSVPLLKGLGSAVNLNGIKDAEYAVRSARRSHYLVKVRTVIDAVAATYDIVRQRKLVDQFNAQVERFKGHVVMAEAKEKIGLATPIDVFRAQIRLKDSQNSLNRSQQALRTAGDRLKIVLATPLEQAIEVVAPLTLQPVDVGISQAVETAMQHRVELKQAEDDLENARRASRLSKNNLLPQLDLVSSYSRFGKDEDFNDSTDFSEESWSVRLQISETEDLARTADKAGYQQALLTVKRQRLDRLTQIDAIKREVRQFYDALIKTQERIQIRNDQISQARGKLALANVKFNHGMANNFDLIEAETELQAARTNMLAAQIDYIVGMYRLRGAMGTLVQ